MAKAHFTGPIRAEWLPDGWIMQLLETVVFVDSQGRRWTSSAGRLINGASIPPIVQPLIAAYGKLHGLTCGTYYVGPYRDGSVPHDTYCVDRRESPSSPIIPHEQVHWMFYEAMLARGTPEDLARMIYKAVMQFGPQWNELGEDTGWTGHENDPQIPGGAS